MQIRTTEDEKFSNMVGNLLGPAPEVVALGTTLVKTIACSAAENGKHEVKCNQWGREIQLIQVKNPTTEELSDFAILVEGTTNYYLELGKDEQNNYYAKVVEQYRVTQTKEVGPSVRMRDMPGGYDISELQPESIAVNAAKIAEESLKTEFEEETSQKASTLDKISTGFVEAVYKPRKGKIENTIGVVYRKTPITDFDPVRTDSKGDIIVSYWMPVTEIIDSVRSDQTIFGTPGAVLWGLVFASSKVTIEFDF